MQGSEKKNLVLGLATGKTMIPLYKELVNRYKKGEVDFSNVRTFNLDEYRGLNGKDVKSFRRFMDKNFFSKVNIKEKNIHFLDGRAEDVDVECKKYEREIKIVGGIDLQILGLGRNGHIAFNEPGSSENSKTRVVELSESTRRANARVFGGEKKVPRSALSMGIGTIMGTREIILVATGQGKRSAVRAMLSGRISRRCPASILRKKKGAVIVFDCSAAKFI